MKRLAADQFMRSGYIEEGMKLFTELSERVGIRLVRTPRGALIAMALCRLYTRSRFLLPWPELSGSHATEIDIARLEMLRTGGIILNIVDPVAAAHFQVKYVVEALKARRLNQDPLHFEDNGYFTFTVKLTELLVALRSCVCAEVEIVFLMFEPEAAMA
jgi:hypothetical protein